MVNRGQVSDKEKVFNNYKEKLDRAGISIHSIDMERPWGGFFVIEPSSLSTFLETFFNTGLLNKHFDKLPLSPKVLIVKPNKRLSWQYHNRRSEIWSVIKGPVGVIKSEDDTQGKLVVYQNNDQIELQKGERHRLAGLTDWGVIAEIWQHSDPDHPSDEEDIIRLEDDFGR